MHRPGTNPDDVQLEDILCDFCGVAAWSQGRPCVEGHHGSIICGSCLSVAWVELVNLGGGTEGPAQCALCLVERDGPVWTGARGEAFACRRCVKQSAGVLHKSTDWDWRKPE